MEALYIGDILVNCQHLINIPILKSHVTGVTGALKNHVGSQSTSSSSGSSVPDPIHNNVSESLADLNNNPHIRDKTRLIVADGLFGNWSHGVIDDGVMVNHPWLTFGNGAPNSMFFSFDPVALDSVMYDIIIAEEEARGNHVFDDDHLQYAEDLGLGIHENKPYSRIDYKEIDISANGGGCFIATAVYGTSSCHEVRILRQFRDERLISHRLGKILVFLYYKISPPLASFIKGKPRLKHIMRKCLNQIVALIIKRKTNSSRKIQLS
jgi:hypothetical protein